MQITPGDSDDVGQFRRRWFRGIDPGDHGAIATQRQRPGVTAGKGNDIGRGGRDPGEPETGIAPRHNLDH